MKRPGLPDPPGIMSGSHSPSWRCPLRTLRDPFASVLKPSCRAILTCPVWVTSSSWCSFLVSSSCRRDIESPITLRLTTHLIRLTIITVAMTTRHLQS